MYNARESNAPARTLASILSLAARELHALVGKMQRHSDALPHLIKIHDLENEGDLIYRSTVGEMFQNNTDPLYVMKWKELYELLEESIDYCERAADVVEGIILKHS